MRILMVIGVFPRPSETFLLRKALALQEHGHVVRVLCRAIHPDADRLYPPQAHGDWRGFVIQRPTTLSSALPKAILNSILCLLRVHPFRLSRYLCVGKRYIGLGRTIRRLYLDSYLLHFRPDIIHFEFPSSARGHIVAGRLTGIPTVVSFRGTDAFRRGIGDDSYYDDIWQWADGIHTLGPDLLRQVRSRGMPEDLPVQLIPPAVDISRYGLNYRVLEASSRRGTRENPLRVLSVGRLTREKGHDIALLAIARAIAQGTEIRYTVLGDGALRDELKALATSLSVMDRVTFQGHVPNDEVRDELCTHDVLLHPARWEGYGNSIVEAQVSGLPTVTTDVAGLRDAVKPNVTGVVVPPESVEEISKALITLAESPEILARLGHMAQMEGRRLHNMDGHVVGFEQLYANVIARREN